jgi:hypothetical protein
MNNLLVRCDTREQGEGKCSKTLLKKRKKKFTIHDTLNYIELTKEKLERR